MAKQTNVRSFKVASAKPAEQRTFETRIDIEDESREQVIAILNSRLADSLDVQTQTKFAHWNVKGNDFYQLHLLFDEIAEHLEDAVDLIAERATALGGRANGTVRQAAKNSQIEEYDLDAVKGMDHVRALSDRLATFANICRGTIDETDELGDKATADVFTEIVRQADKDLYFLESHIQA
ncbi:MAG: starvation/stationary phase protection protein Dps [Candidatus Angelobacter sp.]|jgi:starvation-inducible DNA-binding protein|nr:starvation/stationary phase protection protein Dps [Candidatus Angelobacter sp.]